MGAEPWRSCFVFSTSVPSWPISSSRRAQRPPATGSDGLSARRHDLDAVPNRRGPICRHRLLGGRAPRYGRGQPTRIFYAPGATDHRELHLPAQTRSVSRHREAAGLRVPCVERSWPRPEQPGCGAGAVRSLGDAAHFSRDRGSPQLSARH